MATLNLGRVGFVNKGTYSDTTPYKINDVVTYNRGTYACIEANTGNLPTDIAYWQVWVENTAPSNTGEGATGTWNIDITGSASELNNKVESITVISNTLVERDINGNINTNTVNISEAATSDIATKYYVETNNDGYLRPKLLSDVKTEIAGDKVSKNGNETIGGVKTFSSSPIVPTPTAGNQAVNRDYVNNKYSGFKNYIINGNFDIWQRGTSQTNSGYGSADRWHNSNAGSTKTHSRVACTDTERALFNASYFSRTVVSSVPGNGNYVQKVQRIEDITKLAGKKVTLSFWAKADTNKNIAIEFEQIFGTGGTSSGGVGGIGAQKILLTTTWTKYTIIADIPSIIGKTIGTDGVHTSFTSVHFWLDAGSNFNLSTANLGQQSGTFDIAQVQLEEGSVATPFEQRPVGLELSLCQRYYEVVDVKEQPQAAVFYNNWRYLPVVSFTLKRVIPTASFLSSVIYPNAVTYSTDYLYNVTRTTVGLVDMMTRGTLYTYSIALDAEL